MNPMSKVKDNKCWNYVDMDGATIGLMRCVDCGKKVKAPFRYYSTSEAYVNQCFDCGHEQPSWAKRLTDESERQRVQDLEDRRTDILTLLQRMKDAFFEGYSDAGLSAYDMYESVDELWEKSETKRVYDILYKQAMEQ